MSSFFLENFGCRATQADGAAIERQFQQKGFTRAPDSLQADLVILNTCTVTASADQDVRARIRHIHRGNPSCRILVTGCYAQRAPEELSQLPGVRWVVGNSHKHLLESMVGSGLVTAEAPGVFPGSGHDERAFPAEILVGDIFAHTELLAAPVFGAGAERTRPNLKVQDGCNNRCSFCVIPSVRGRSRSLPLERVLLQVNELVAAGYRELVLSGINLGRWGRDLPAPSASGRRLRFEDLLRAILNETALEKLRISSVEPMDWSDELIELLATSPRIAKHAHVPLQSGSDAVLRRMHRKYRPWHYAEKVLKIRSAAREAAIGADVMTGFPGETEKEFEQTRAFVEELPFTYLHVFTFSARPGTPAASMDGQVPAAVARERSRILREIAARKKRDFMASFAGRELPAITLHGEDAGFTRALTDNYLKLRLRGVHAPNCWVTAAIEAVQDDCLIGGKSAGEPLGAKAIRAGAAAASFC